MASKKVYDKCVVRNRKTGRRNLYTGSYKPCMKFLFGHKTLVTKSQFKLLSEKEQVEHLKEDRVLISMYLEM